MDCQSEENKEEEKLFWAFMKQEKIKKWNHLEFGSFFWPVACFKSSWYEKYVLNVQFKALCLTFSLYFRFLFYLIISNLQILAENCSLRLCNLFTIGWLSFLKIAWMISWFLIRYWNFSLFLTIWNEKKNVSVKSNYWIILYFLLFISWINFSKLHISMKGFRIS